MNKINLNQYKYKKMTLKMQQKMNINGKKYFNFKGHKKLIIHMFSFV